MFLLFFCLLDLSISKRRVLKSPVVTMVLSLSPFSSLRFYFSCFAALLLGAGIFGIAMSSWWTDHLSLLDSPLCLW